MDGDAAGVDTATLFSGRADQYARYRPGYPAGMMDLLEREAVWTPASVVADIGSGTGIASGLFLARGNKVFAVEPNAEMRRAAETRWHSHPGFVSVEGTAERTTLPDATVDLVICATSFHWFDPDASRAEFLRILKPDGHVVLAWNVRRADATPFMAAYEQFVRGYERRRAGRLSGGARGADQVASFFAPRPVKQRTFENPQQLDREGLKGRFVSGSYAPLPGDARFEPAMRAVEALFDRFAADGLVTLTYDTFVYWGRLG